MAVKKFPGLVSGQNEERRWEVFGKTSDIISTISSSVLISMHLTQIIFNVLSMSHVNLWSCDITCSYDISHPAMLLSVVPFN